jgi:two-component system, OmpR family, sensor histidine kinase MprB
VTLRARIAVTAAAAVALAFLIAAGGLYAATARTLRGEVDRSLAGIAEDLTSGRPERVVRSLAGSRAGALGGPGGFVQVVDSAGAVLGPGDAGPRLPHGAEEAAVAAGDRGPFYTTVDVADQSVRVLTVPILDGIAAQVARPLDEIEASLAALRTRLALGGLVGIALAVALGVLVARGAVRPVEQLTALAEDVAATGDLTRRIDVGGALTDAQVDELGRLARTFNAMLANLEQARVVQQQLVADASHELRTPLTSLRTNIEVLMMDAAPAEDADPTPLSPADRRQLLADLTVQLDEFGRLVGALVELARGAQPAVATVPVQLDDLVATAVDRARAFAGPDQRIDLVTTPVTVRGEADRLERAVANLLDNAVKYGRSAPIDVRVGRDGRAHAIVTVRDHGPGIPAEHLPQVFDRFYRAPDARDAPGSGLGLSIVAQVVEAHAGRVEAVAADGGGTAVTMQLPADATDG